MHMTHLVIGLSVLLCEITISRSISCKDERGKEVDWYIIYKFPKIESEPRNTHLGKGVAYAYVSKTSSEAKWRLSHKSIASDKSALGYTLKEFFENKKKLAYLLYNDQPPDNDTSTSVGHTKGVIAFEKCGGLWLIHSIPKFVSNEGYEYPDSGRENGQTAMCINFPATSLNEIGKQLIYNHPHIYSKGKTNLVDTLDDDVQTLFSEKPLFIRKPPYFRITSLKRGRKMQFISFAKDNQFNNDLYSALVAPELTTPLLTETWQRGSGTVTPPSCQTQFTVRDITHINITAVYNNKNKFFDFKSKEDHSKWAISTDSNAKFVCIGDINRMNSQRKRGGGTTCFEQKAIWKLYTSMIAETDTCK